MRLLMFPQWDKLSALLRTMARQSAADYCQRNIVRLEPKGGRVQLADRSANNLSVAGGETTVVMPDIEPGKVRDCMWLLRPIHRIDRDENGSVRRSWAFRRVRVKESLSFF